MTRWWWVAAVGCSGDKDDGIEPLPTDTDTDTGEAPEPTGDTGTAPESPDLVVDDSHVYDLSVTWDIATTDVRASWDLLFSWTALSVDAWGEPIDEATIPVLALFEILAPSDEIAAGLAADSFGTDLLSIWEADVTGLVFANASLLAYQSSPFDPVNFLLEESGKTWLAALCTQQGERLDIRTAVALVPDESSGTTAVVFDDTRAAVSWSGAFDGSPLVTSAGQAPYTVDWSTITTDALGKPYDRDAGDALFVARFDDRLPANLGTDLVDLPSAASAWYTMDVGGDTDARLDLAADGAGEPFPGFDTGGTWVVGVRCTTCLTRFPLWAAVVEVR